MVISEAAKRLINKAFYMSLRLAIIISALGLVYGRIMNGAFTGRYAFRANFWVGTTILLAGILRLITPTALLMKKNRLIDHTTYGQRFMEERERNRSQAWELISTGLCLIFITGAVQLLIWFVF